MTLPVDIAEAVAIRSASSTARAAVRCRAIRDTDGAALVRLLRQGFPERSETYWTTAIDRLLGHVAVLGVSGGVVLDCEGDLVGVLLLLPGGEPAGSRFNLSSWFVDPRFAAYATLLANQAVRRKALTYVNISPAPHTRPTIEAQGFVRCSQGRILALPALMPPRRRVRVRAFDPLRHGALPAGERDLLVRHAGYGCLAVVAETGQGPQPFLVLPWRIGGRWPGAQLVWCRDIADFVRLAGPLGRFLLRRGMLGVLVDLCGPLDGLLGPRIGDRCPKYVKGPDQPRTGDLADTELVMFGP